MEESSFFNDVDGDRVYYAEDFAEYFIPFFTNGIFNNNVTTSNALESNIQRAAFKNAKQKVVVADSTKFNISDVYTFYKLSDLNYVITDDQLDEDTLKYFNTFGNILNKEKTL